MLGPETCINEAGFRQTFPGKTLAIISDCVHFTLPNGRIATENHILLSQIKVLARHFSHTLICCPFVDYDDHKIYTEYPGAFEFYPTPNVGGQSISDKMKILRTIPVWLKTFKKINYKSDFIYLRFPNNLNIPGFFYFNNKHKPLFATYTGTWEKYRGEPRTYRLQKYLLKHFFKGPVFAYIKKENAKDHLHTTFSPSYSLEKWYEEIEPVELKMKSLLEGGKKPFVFISVGAFNAMKNQQFILDTFKTLNEKKIDYQLYLVGDGPLKKQYEQFLIKNHLTDRIIITGKLKADELRILYRKADFLIQASLVEGYGKVPVEGYFHGVVPFLYHTAMSEEILGAGKYGFEFENLNPVSFAQYLLSKIEDQADIVNKLKAGRQYAKSLTLDQWSLEMIEVIKQYHDNKR
ncbi:MAG: glycosyltransferase [Bacteroidetes bacterium]|nr:glycosyltransferase [Bacteroidota bacterium]